MSQKNEGGFTIVEVLIAVIILSVGVLALVGSGAAVTRMIGQGRRTTNVAQVALNRMETLRRAAGTTSPTCTAVTSGTATTSGVSEQWTVSGTGRSRTVRLLVTYRSRRQLKTDLHNTTIACP